MRAATARSSASGPWPAAVALEHGPSPRRSRGDAARKADRGSCSAFRSRHHPAAARNLWHRSSPLSVRGVLAGAVGEAAAAGMGAIAVPWPSVRAAVAGLSWNGQVVMDATNAFKADLGGRTSSEIVIGLVPGARLVKAANTLAAALLGADPHEADGRRVIFLSGDDAPAKAAGAGLFGAAGFFPIDPRRGWAGGRPAPVRSPRR